MAALFDLPHTVAEILASGAGRLRCGIEPLVRAWLAGLLAIGLLVVARATWAHAISEGNAAFVEGVSGVAVGVFGYLGAKHMFTGVDHVLYLVGVVFYLHRLRDVLAYVTIFTLGHSITLLAGVLVGWRMDAHLVDAVIGLSVVYKAFENIGGFERNPLPVLAGGATAGVGRSIAPDPRLAVFVFGLCHGMGLATRVQGLQLSPEGLLVNLVSFNVGVEVGQLAALGVVLGVLAWWRRTASFERSAFGLNVLLMVAGFLLMQVQLAAYFLSGEGG